jgi:Xaa-Pro aminopeptidase
MTRTIFIGEPTPEQKEIYNLVLKNQERVIEEIKEGANIKTLVQGVESDFKINGYDLIHGLGHGVGMEIHEKPFFSGVNDNYLKENMIITDEPGIYIAGNFGIRIEDTVLVTKQGALVLTDSNKECIML